LVDELERDELATRVAALLEVIGEDRERVAVVGIVGEVRQQLVVGRPTHVFVTSTRTAAANTYVPARSHVISSLPSHGAITRPRPHSARGRANARATEARSDGVG
jgi:hypothetical protein